ncbi:PREDICTED: cation channel sperm-associated protein subunit beta-like [Gekko japonicus]|uniref:Cation channel sperm-associated protein subunit beta-like n=1 Tax=Gekko japonicus TaxID=146911 RepID=A0ABM1L9F4_GEKJA|nr:PREDICTED: cation channel sperm-associated protein subunit beta-like [Gekko japonicus]
MSAPPGKGQSPPPPLLERGDSVQCAAATNGQQKEKAGKTPKRQSCSATKHSKSKVPKLSESTKPTAARRATDERCQAPLTVAPIVLAGLSSNSPTEVSCHLFDKHEIDSDQNKRKNLVLYTSAGLAPTVEIFNSSYSKVFYFKMLLAEDQLTWSLNVPRQDIAHNTADIAPTEQWYVKFNMHHGLNMFTTEGTLLDTAREPILQWILSDPLNISALIPNVINITVTKSPCASDVAIIGLIFEDDLNGIYIGISLSGFTTRDIYWTNMTDDICVLLDYDCGELALLNVILTNTRIIFLTTLGLFISEDLRYGDFLRLKFNKPNFCGFERDDYFRAKIWYNIQCLANQENYEVDYISLSFNKDKTLSQGRALVAVNKLTNHRLNRRRKFPDFWFPDSEFVAFGMFFHPNSHFLYVYGNQVWFSEDGGNKFQLLIKLVNETVVKTDTCVYTQAIVFATDKGSVFYTKAGLHRYAKLTTVQLNIFNMYFDHLGDLYCVSLNETAQDFLKVQTMDVNTLLQEDDLAFDGALSPQYITEEQIMFFSHIPLSPHVNPIQPRFYNLYIGKALEYGLGGSGIINKVFEHSYSPKFSSSVLVDILDRFPVETSTSSPCVLNTLTIQKPDPGTTAFKLQLSASDSHIFQASDVEKTVVIPGFSSFLIISVTDNLTALTDATMPQRVPVNIEFQSKQWFLYDFGTTNGRKWRVVVDRCRYTIQQLDDLPVHAIKYLDLGSKLHFSFRVSPVNVAYPVFQMPLMEVIVGKPNLLDVDTEDYWDDTDSYTIQLHVQSRFFEQGKTSISVIVTQASLVCDVTTLILTLKNSCSYLKVMHYTLPVQLPASVWLSHLPNASKLLKVLPVNYRPPSRLGIAVPLTENFYNADPAKPRMRDYFQGSKSSGTYKQCASKTKRSECGCTDNMKLSFLVAFSDCKEKAIRMKYPISKLPLSFTVENEDGSVNLSSPYFVTITEVNNRTNWEISATNKTSSLLKMRTYLAHRLNTTLYNPDGLTLSIYGSELFHFRVATIPGVSFCSLFDEFQV